MPMQATTYPAGSLANLSAGAFDAEILRRNAERRAEAAAGVTINRPLAVNGADLDRLGSNGLRHRGYAGLLPVTAEWLASR